MSVNAGTSRTSIMSAQSSRGRTKLSSKQFKDILSLETKSQLQQVLCDLTGFKGTGKNKADLVAKIYEHGYKGPLWPSERSSDVFLKHVPNAHAKVSLPYEAAAAKAAEAALELVVSPQKRRVPATPPSQQRPAKRARAEDPVAAAPAPGTPARASRGGGAGAGVLGHIVQMRKALRQLRSFPLGGEVADRVYVKLAAAAVGETVSIVTSDVPVLEPFVHTMLAAATPLFVAAQSSGSVAVRKLALGGAVGGWPDCLALVFQE